MISNFLKEMDPDILRANISRRNAAIENLKAALVELKKGRKEINHIAMDPCHIGTDQMIHDDYNCLIREMESLIRTMIGGDWCFSVNNTVNREEELKRT